MINREVYKQILIINHEFQKELKSNFNFIPYLKKIAKIAYGYGFSEPKTSDELPKKLCIFDGTCDADMNNWNW